MCLTSVIPLRDQSLKKTGLFPIFMCELYHRGEDKNCASDVKFSVKEASHQISRISLMKRIRDLNETARVLPSKVS